jgi:hypothetical protein
LDITKLVIKERIPQWLLQCSSETLVRMLNDATKLIIKQEKEIADYKSRIEKLGREIFEKDDIIGELRSNIQRGFSPHHDWE